MAPWNVPDWREAGAYEYIKSLNQTGRKWEALRRFYAYRAKWQRYRDAKGGFGLTRMLDPRVRGDALPLDLAFVDDEWQGRVMDNRWDVTNDYLDLLFENDVVLVCVDLMRPLSPQLDAAENVLKTLRAKAAEESVLLSRSAMRVSMHARAKAIAQKKNSTTTTTSRVVTRARRRPMLIEHLRAADARDQGATWETVADVIWDLQSDSDGASDAKKRHDNFFRDLHRLAPGP